MTVRSHSWANLASRLRRYQLMDAMLDRLGIDTLAAIRQGEAFIQARAHCRTCHCVGACRDWFLEDQETPAEFCPNAGLFAKLVSR
jgi:Family of unknown function (DUF6455)